ncbi:Nuclear migration protein nudC [Seminavis robusta]|uniref:Nuclear migration protein nudC n=1 Tax=Seminavis robusta TaxID=568900 RepID=A0A9N8HVU3_9STRA|nr:Nuclear migration protein nudC [Seminavis robusta]|eukprot:Sro2053_g312690.1 Nuclear migration protein nudC (350) ;mRNA; f:11811-12860
MSSSKFVDDDRFDGLYLNVASAAHGIEPLLDTVFSFLRRKTDFFAGPPGATDGTQVAIQKVNQVLQKHAALYEKEHAKKKPPPPQKKAKKEEVIEMGADGGFDVTAAAAATTTKKEKTPPAATPKVEEKKKKVEETPADKPKSDTEVTPTTKDDKDNSEEPDNDGKVIPSKGNGGTVDGKYVWTQILAELSVTVPLPDNTRGRDLNVTISRKHLKVGLRNALKNDNGGTATKWLVDDDLIKPIVTDDSFWTVEDGNRLVLNLQKTNAMEWWDAVCVNDTPKINVQKIQPENSQLGDLDGETRKTVEKMMFDQRQKAAGLPTSEEQQKFDMIEKFKKQHPELDFSQAKIS